MYDKWIVFSILDTKNYLCLVHICYSIYEKHLKFIASKMLEIKSRHLTLGGPKYMFIGGFSLDITLAVRAFLSLSGNFGVRYNIL